jgi:hypothetical protein
VTLWFRWNGKANAGTSSYRKKCARSRPQAGFICSLCASAGTHCTYPNLQALWRDHLFDPFEDWINTKLARAQAIALYPAEEALHINGVPHNIGRLRTKNGFAYRVSISLKRSAARTDAPKRSHLSGRISIAESLSAFLLERDSEPVSE